jgi:hypothetical protein
MGMTNSRAKCFFTEGTSVRKKVYGDYASFTLLRAPHMLPNGEPMNDSRRVENDSTKPAAMAILKVGLLGQMQ